MFSSIFLKTLYDKRWFLIGWTIGSVALLTLTAAFYPVIADSIGSLLKSIPAGLQNIVGDNNAYSTYQGYVGSAVFGVRALMLYVPLAIILGLSLGAADESSRKLYQLLAQPKSRRTITWQKWAAGLTVIAVIIAIIYAAMIVTSIVIGETVPYAALGRICLMSGLFTAALFSLTYGVAVAFGRKSLALGLPIVWVFASLLIDSFSANVAWLKDIDWLSALTYFSTSHLVTHAASLKDVLVLGGIGLVGFFVALIFFPLRDVRDSQ